MIYDIKKIPDHLKKFFAPAPELGSEPSPDCSIGGQLFCGVCHVCRMREVFREVRRVLRDDGTCWLNYGDSYSTSPRGNKEPGGGNLTNSNIEGKGYEQSRFDGGKAMDKLTATGLKSGNLVGVPWRVALALQADGWILRQDVIWHKPSPMPESVRNRCTKAHEYVFLLTKKGSGYFYDAEAIKERVKSELKSASWKDRVAAPAATGDLEQGVRRNHGKGMSHDLGGTDGRSNKRSVWSVSSQGYEGAHFATFPEALIRPMILAGTSAHGCCGDCGAPWRRVTEEEKLRRDRPNEYVKRVPTLTGGVYAPSGQPPHSNARPPGLSGPKGVGRISSGIHQGGVASSTLGKVKTVAGKSSGGNVNTCSNSVAGVSVRTVGWEPTCTCHGTFEKRTVVVEPETEAESREKHGNNAFRNSDKYVNNSSFNNSGETVDGNLDRRGGEKTVQVYVPTTPLDEHPVVPCTVLDIFVGSGTTVAVALDNGRYGVGIDLSDKYLTNNAVPRVVGGLLSKPATAHLVPGRKPSGLKGVRATRT